MVHACRVISENLIYQNDELIMERFAEVMDVETEKPERHLSKLERKRFDAMASSVTVKEAAAKLGIAEGTLNNWNYKLRKRLRRERGHLNACLSQQKRCALLKEILSVKRPLEEVGEEVEF